MVESSEDHNIIYMCVKFNKNDFQVQRRTRNCGVLNHITDGNEDWNALEDNIRRGLIFSFP